MKVVVPLKRKARIEMLPLIDIVFLLLVFFIYAMLSMAVHRGLPVELPVSSSAEQTEEQVLSVTVSQADIASNIVFVNEEPVELPGLAARLRALAAGRQGDEPGVLLFADRQVSYQKLFSVLDQISMAGLSRISLQADVEQ